MPVPLHLFDPLPLCAVTGGAFGLAMLQTGHASLAPAFSALFRVFHADPEKDRDWARATVNAVDQIAEVEGLPRSDHVRTGPGFLRDAIHRLADRPEAEPFASWAGRQIADRATRHARSIAFWDAVADAGPAMGMAGTILGLVGMFAGMSDPTTIGPAMAFALLTTLYGMVLANMVAGPVARRLEALSTAEIAWQRELVDRLVTIARREAALLPSNVRLAPRAAA